MTMQAPPWDQRLASVLVRPLTKTPITPNQVTVFTLVVALAGAGLIAVGTTEAMNWGAGLFILARFLDHFDGELARQTGRKSKLGYYLDYLSGMGSYSALFLCMGVGFRHTELGWWAVALGAAGLVSAVASMFINLGIDKAQGGSEDGDACGYPGFLGFELEDGVYLLGPLTWLGFLYPFFVVACAGAVAYTLWSLFTLVRLRARATV